MVSGYLQRPSTLAALSSSQGRYPDAEPHHKCSLAIYEKALEPEYPQVLAEHYLGLRGKTGAVVISLHRTALMEGPDRP